MLILMSCMDQIVAAGLALESSEFWSDGMAQKPDNEIHKRLERLSGILLRIALVCTAIATMLAIHSAWG